MTTTNRKSDQSIAVSDRVRVTTTGHEGVVRYIGSTEFDADVWYGIELDDATGENDGSVLEVSYFKCRPKHGTFNRQCEMKLIAKGDCSLRRNQLAEPGTAHHHTDACDKSHSEWNESAAWANLSRNAPSRRPSSLRFQPRGESRTILEYPPPATKSHRVCIGDEVETTKSVWGTGIVRFIGCKTDDEKNIEFGLELYKTAGDCNGRLGGRRYFKCKKRRGLFVTPRQVKSVTKINEKNRQRITVSDRVRVLKTRSEGVVRFIGTTEFAKDHDIWYGIELDEPTGKNNGSVRGVSYFKCPAKQGTFQRASKLQLISEGGLRLATCWHDMSGIADSYPEEGKPWSINDDITEDASELDKQVHELTGSNARASMADKFLTAAAQQRKLGIRQPRAWANELSKSHITIAILREFGEVMDSENEHWLREFVVEQGLTRLVSIAPRAGNNWKLVDVLLECVQTIANSEDDHGVNFGMGLIIEHAIAVSAICDMFEFHSKCVQIRVLRLMCQIASSPDGLTKVLDAMERFRTKKNAKSIFDEFIRAMYFETDFEARLYTLKLVNIVMRAQGDNRPLLRERLMDLGFHTILREIRQIGECIEDDLVTKIDEQIDMYEQCREEDEHPLVRRTANPMTAPLLCQAPIKARIPRKAPIPAPIPVYIPRKALLPVPIPDPIPSLQLEGAPKPAPIPAPAPIPGKAPIPGCAPVPIPLETRIPAPVRGVALFPGVLPCQPLPGMTPGLLPKKKKGLGKKKKIKPRVKMNPLHWTKLKPKMVKNSVWLEIDDEALDLDIDLVEASFKKKEAPKKKAKKKGKKKEVVETISLIPDPKRSYNISIGLASSLKMPSKTIRDAVLAMDEVTLNLDEIEKLMRVTPTPEEQALYKNFTGDPAHLDAPDQFLYALHDIDEVVERLEMWKFKIEFPELLAAEQEKLDLLVATHDTIKESEGLRVVLQYILAAGNYMNGGTKKGQAHGFSLSTLPMLKRAKSTTGTGNFLMTIVRMIQKEQEDALRFVEDLRDLPSVLRLVGIVQETESELNGYRDRFSSIENAIKNFNGENKEDMFAEIMTDFTTEYKHQCDDLWTDFRKMCSSYSTLGQFFGEDKNCEFEYLEYINEFRNDVMKILARIEKEKERERQREREQEREKKEQVLLQALEARRRRTALDIYASKFQEHPNMIKREETEENELDEVLSSGSGIQKHPMLRLVLRLRGGR